MELPFSSFISRELRALTLGRSVAVAGRVGEAAGTQRKGCGGGGRVGGGGMMASTACSLGWASGWAPGEPARRAIHAFPRAIMIVRNFTSPASPSEAPARQKSHWQQARELPGRGGGVSQVTVNRARSEARRRGMRQGADFKLPPSSLGVGVG